MKVKQSEKKEIGRIRLSDTQDLVVSLVGNERVDIRVWMQRKNYEGPTRRGVRFYLFDDNWPEFKKLMEKVDKECKELA